MQKGKRVLVGVGLLMLIGLVSAAGVQAQFFTRVASVESAVAESAQTMEADEVPVVRDVEIAQEVETLVARWSADVLDGAGWLHVITYHDRNKDQAGALPNGQPIPLDYISDTWYQLNDEGLAIAVVAILKDKDGQMWQASTFRDGMWRNLTLDEKYPGQGPFVPQLDFGFSRDVAQAQSWGSTLSRDVRSLRGSLKLAFTIHDDFAEPVQIAGYEEPVASADILAEFDPQTGEMLHLQRQVVTTEGEQQVVERVNILTIERATDLPADVSTLLSKEVAR